MAHRTLLVTMTMLLVLSSPALIEAIPSSWGQEGHDARHTWASEGSSPATSAELWRSGTGGSIHSGVNGRAVGAVVDGVVFARQSDGIVALDELTGNVVRTYSVGNPRNFAVADGRLVVGNDEGAVRAFDVSSGSLMWARTSLPIPNIAVDSGRVFVNTGLGDGHLRALDLATGATIWAASGVGNASSSPTVAGSLVVQNTANGGTVRAFDAATGAPAWSAATGTAISSPVADATRLFQGIQSNHLIALSQANGAVLWDASLPGEIYAGGTTGGLAFATSFNGTVYALDAATGTLSWSFSTGSGFLPSAMASAGGRVFLSSQTDAPVLYALDVASGALLWSLPGAEAPIVAGGRVFAVADGDIVAIGSRMVSTPEPASLLLAGLGLACPGVFAVVRHVTRRAPRG
jgi:outer membrane protein assembly factor BamB